MVLMRSLEISCCDFGGLLQCKYMEGEMVTGGLVTGD